MPLIIYDARTPFQSTRPVWGATQTTQTLHLPRKASIITTLIYLTLFIKSFAGAFNYKTESIKQIQKAVQLFRLKIINLFHCKQKLFICSQSFNDVRNGIVIFLLLRPFNRDVIAHKPLKQQIQTRAADYASLVYTDDQIANAKKDRADLNRLKKALNDERIRQEKEFLQPFNEFKANADALLMNSTMIAKIQTMARLLGYKTESEDAFGRKVTAMDGVRFMDLGKHYTVADTTVTGNDCVKAGISRNIGASNAAVTGLTDIYAVKFDVNDGFHAASLTGTNAIRKYLPDFNTPGAVKDGEVEMVAATVLKNTAHAGVLRNIKIA